MNATMKAIRNVLVSILLIVYLCISMAGCADTQATAKPSDESVLIESSGNTTGTQIPEETDAMTEPNTEATPLPKRKLLLPKRPTFTAIPVRLPRRPVRKVVTPPSSAIAVIPILQIKRMLPVITTTRRLQLPAAPKKDILLTLAPSVAIPTLGTKQMQPVIAGVVGRSLRSQLPPPKAPNSAPVSPVAKLTLAVSPNCLKKPSLSMRPSAAQLAATTHITSRTKTGRAIPSRRHLSKYIP